MIQYQNRWAVVTGASSGLGSRLAVRLADRGMSVLLTGRNQSRLNRVGRDIRQAAPRVAVETIVANHSTSSGISELLNHVGDRPIEVLVNNAGFGSYGRVTGRWLRPETKARAPIEARNEILIPASPERVWDLLTDVEGWPSWYRACQWVRLESNEDSTLSEKEQRLSFRWKAHPVELRSVVVASERPHLFAIIADAPGLHAERKFTLSPAPNGSTPLSSAMKSRLDYCHGWPVGMFSRGYMRQTMRCSTISAPPASARPRRSQPQLRDKNAKCVRSGGLAYPVG